MQRRGIGGSPTNNDGDVEFINELFEVQWLTVLAHVLGTHRGPTDDKKVNARFDHGVRKLVGALRAQSTRDRNTSISDFGKSLGDQLWLDWLRINPLQSAGRLIIRQRRDFCVCLRGVVIPGPQTLEVQDTKSAQFTQCNGAGRGHHRVHRCGNYGAAEGERINFPLHRDVFGVAGAPAWHDRNIVKRVRPNGTLRESNFNLIHVLYPIAAGECAL